VETHGHDAIVAPTLGTNLDLRDGRILGARRSLPMTRWLANAHEVAATGALPELQKGVKDGARSGPRSAPLKPHGSFSPSADSGMYCVGTDYPCSGGARSRPRSPAESLYRGPDDNRRVSCSLLRGPRGRTSARAGFTWRRSDVQQPGTFRSSRQPAVDVHRDSSPRLSLVDARGCPSPLTRHGLVSEKILRPVQKSGRLDR
jgi:hypothetical protein